MAQTVQQLLQSLLQGQIQQNQLGGQVLEKGAIGFRGGIKDLAQNNMQGLKTLGQTELSPGGMVKDGMQALQQLLPGASFMKGAQDALKKRAKEDEKKGAESALAQADKLGLDQTTMLLNNAQQFITQKSTVQDPAQNATSGNSSLLPPNPNASVMDGVPDSNSLLSMQDPATQTALNNGQQSGQLNTATLQQLLDSQSQSPSPKPSFGGGSGLGGRFRGAKNAFATALMAPAFKAQNQELTNQLATQKLEGKEKLQDSEREKISLKFQNDLLKIAKTPVDAMTPENATKFGALMDGGNAVTSISNMLNDNVTAQLFAQGVPSFLKSQKAKLLSSNIERAVQSKTRAESGAAMPPEELKATIRRFMPQKGDTLKTSLQRLKPLNDYFSGALNMSDPTGVHRQRADGQQTQAGIQKIIQQATQAKQRGAVGYDTDKGIFVDAQGNEVK